jgi:GNAT superfamily N-acetyltransferase
MSTFTVSPLDTRRWGVLTAKANHVCAPRLPGLFDEARAQGVRFLIVRCPTADPAVAHELERQGAHLMDTIVTYTRSLVDLPPRAEPAVRPAEEADTPCVRELARAAFVDYRGHYHADPRLDRRQCDDVYVDWATRSCMSREVADEVLVSELDGGLSGFATLQGQEGVLFGVSPHARGRGIYRALMLAGMDACARRGATRMFVSTQLNNMAVQRVWTRLGFELSESRHTFHGWLA